MRKCLKDLFSLCPPPTSEMHIRSSVQLFPACVKTFPAVILARKYTGILQAGYASSVNSRMILGHKSSNLHDCYIQISKFVEGSEGAKFVTETWRMSPLHVLDSMTPNIHHRSLLKKERRKEHNIWRVP